MFESYRQGNGVDTIAGIEAIISHVITKELLIPCAHAPAFASIEVGKSFAELIIFLNIYYFVFKDEIVSPKACAEEIGYTFLPCILSYLHRAPNLVDIQENQSIARLSSSSMKSLITNEDVDAVVVPVSSFTYILVIISCIDFISQMHWVDLQYYLLYHKIN